MSLKITLKLEKLRTFFSIIALLLLSNNLAKAQCAGEDATITICNIADPTNQTIDLFSLLNGSPTSGGIWNDPLQTGGLDTATGILNVWNIHNSDTYTFTYTVNGVDGCTDNTASIIITIGGYSGITSPNGSACSDNSNVNLFQFFVGDPPSPHLNGVWTDDNNTGALSQNIFDATAVEIGTYSFTYTMPAIGSCPEVSSTAIITVHRSPEPGEAQDLAFCENDDLSIYNNFDLFSLLTEADLNGRWTESSTTELSSPFDSFINIENIFNTHGIGTYNFTYTVYPTNPVCDIKTVSVEITIEELIDLTAGTLQINSNICEDQLEDAIFTAVLTQGTKPITDGTYQVTYEITGQPTPITIVEDFIAGVFTFEIDADNFSGPGQYSITITEIFNVNSTQTCENITGVSGNLEIYKLPNLENTLLSIDPVCLGNDAIVQLSDSILDNGNYEITYTLSGSNSSAAQTLTVSVLNGSGNLIIPSNLIPNFGETTITITNIIHQETLCANEASLSADFMINPLPNLSNITVAIEDVCQNESVQVVLSGLATMENITITYNLSGANQVSDISITLDVNAGNATFTLPEIQIPNTGLSTFTITSLTDNSTNCSVSTSVSDGFTINSIPVAPQANNAVFCEEDNATVNDLEPNGNNYNWYESASSTEPLANETALVSGNYYVSQSGGTNNCSSERTMITVTINTIQPPTLQQDGALFCGADNPTLEDLSANVNASETLVWYDSLTNGTELSPSELLVEGITYYGFQFSNALGCTSTEALAVTVSLTDCDDDEEEYGFFIPDGFSPNGDGVNDTFRIPDIEFLYPNFILEIYNRYGNLMFTGNKNKPNWDGKNSDSNLIDGTAPNGVYFYIINFNKNNLSPKQGRLYLNR